MIDSVFPRLAEEVRTALFFARRALSRHGGGRMESEHLLLGLLEVRPQAVVRFTTPDWTVDRIQGRVIAVLPPGDGKRVPEDAPVAGGTSLGHALLRAAAEADRLASEQIRSEHIVLALINDEGTAGEVLGEIGLTREKLLAFIREQTSC